MLLLTAVRDGHTRCNEEIRQKTGEKTYLLGWDHDTNLLDGLGELIWLHGTVIVQIEILEGLEKNGFLILDSSGLLGQLGLKGFLETKAITRS